MAKKRTTKTATKKTAAPVSTPPPATPVSKAHAGHMLHVRCDTYAQPNAERDGFFEADPKRIGAVTFKPMHPGPYTGEGLVHLLRQACANAATMGGTEIRIKIRRQWHTDTREAE